MEETQKSCASFFWCHWNYATISEAFVFGDECCAAAAQNQGSQSAACTDAACTDAACTDAACADAL